MRRILKSVVFWIIIIELIVIAILAAVGFRITYDPNIITNWEAVSAVSAWVSAIATICIPIVAVLFQNKLDKNKNEIGEANKATLAELKKFMDRYSDILQEMSINQDIISEGNDMFLEFTDRNLLDYICASISITAYDAAVYFDVNKDTAVAKLDSLVEQKRLIRTDIDGIGLYKLRK